jgi:cbb3-type cytochrome oxidase subunit 1
VGRFALAGVGCFVLWGALNAINALQVFRSVTQYTLVTVALDNLILWGGFGLTAIGACYFIFPRLLGRELPFPAWAKLHFSLAAAAVLVQFAAFALGGWLQGVGLANPDKAFVDVMRGWIPFAGMGTLSFLLHAVGGLLLTVNLLVLVYQRARAACEPSVRAWLTPANTKVGVRS